MKEKELRRNLAVFPIGSVMKLTDLTARQIRYYEDQQLITPERTEGNRRMYSLNDMDRLLEIKDYISEGYNIAAIKRKYAEREAMAKKPVSAKDVRRALHNDIVQQSRFASSVPTFGQLKRPELLFYSIRRSPCLLQLLISSAKLKKKMLPLSVLCFQIFWEQ